MEELMKLTEPTVESILSEQSVKSLESELLKEYLKKHKNNKMLKEMLSSLVFVLNMASEYTNIDGDSILTDITTIYINDLTEEERLEEVMDMVTLLKNGGYRNDN